MGTDGKGPKTGRFTGEIVAGIFYDQADVAVASKIYTGLDVPDGFGVDDINGVATDLASMRGDWGERPVVWHTGQTLVKDGHDGGGVVRAIPRLSQIQSFRSYGQE